MSILPLLVLFAVAPSCFANLHYGVKDVKTKTYCLILNATDFGGTVVYYNEYVSEFLLDIQKSIFVIDFLTPNEIHHFLD
jgi:uncharacterized membrane protein YdjX (TVP38/TMEM64 family)